MSILIDHYKHPRYKGYIVDPDLEKEAINRKCGDKVILTARVSEGILQDVRHQSEGCFYCLVSASIACQSIHGRSVDVVKEEINRIRDWLREEGKPDPENPEVEALGEIKKFPMRIDCVDLVWKGLEEMLR